MTTDREHSPAAAAYFAELRAMREKAAAERPAIQAAGVEALHRLMAVAQSDTGQSRVIAHFLLCCYNGYRFQFDLTDFRGLDPSLWNDCMAVLRMDKAPEREVHCYFDNGSAIFEQLAEDWSFPDAVKARREGQ